MLRGAQKNDGDFGVRGLGDEPTPVDTPRQPAQPAQRAPADDAADCVQGGGSSVCNPRTGDYDVDPTNNTCCTKDCTEQHEQKHVADANSWGCCKDLATRIKNGGDPVCLVGEFDKWLNIVRPITECNAYKVSVDCADKLARDRGCNTDAGKRTNCCKNIKLYRDESERKRVENCRNAPRQRPPCPTYSNCRQQPASP